MKTALLEPVRRRVADLPGRKRGALPPRIEAILREACDAAGVTVDELLSRRQLPKIVKARTLAIEKLEAVGCSLMQTARYLGVHHSTVLYRHKKAAARPAEVADIPFPDLSGE